MDTTVVDDMSHKTMNPSTTTIGTSIGSTYCSQSMEPTTHTDSMEAACNTAACNTMPCMMYPC